MNSLFYEHQTEWGINTIPHGRKSFGEHGGFCPPPVTFEFGNVLRPNLAQL